MNKSIRLLWLMLLSLSVQFAQATESIEIKTIEDLISAGELEAQLVIEKNHRCIRKHRLKSRSKSVLIVGLSVALRYMISLWLKL